MTNTARLLVLLSGLLVVGLAGRYLAGGKTVTVTVDGITSIAHIQGATVADALRSAGAVIGPQDIIDPPAGAPLIDGSTIVVQRARPVTIRADGATIELETHTSDIAKILSDAHVRAGERDLVSINGQPARPAALLAAHQTSAAPSSPAASATANRPLSPTQRREAISRRPDPIVIAISRAIPVAIVNEGVKTTVLTAAQKVGDVLFGEGIYIYAADQVTPAFETPVKADMSISIVRAKPLTILADGLTLYTRTQARTVADVLAYEGIGRQAKDYSIPALTSPITAGVTVQVVRVREEYITRTESIPFATEYRPNSNLELDQKLVARQGKPGERKRSTKVVYENGKEVRRGQDSEWVAVEPVTQTIDYGTKVVIRTMDTPHGPIEYWRTIFLRTSYYTPSQSGTEPDAPWFGITITGKRATKGVIGIDPNVIRFHTQMYVPGYGFGAAEDTGNLAIGRVIDLCYDDNDPSQGAFGWENIYLLTPVMPDIPYMLPDY
jgi:resuscitation-promoting factor RpfB